MSDEEKRDWDRQQGESPKAYAHFCLYRDMGVARSLRQVSNLPGCTSVRRQLNRWSSKWRWVERSEKYDDYLERERRVRREKEEGAMHERHTNVALLGMNLAVKGLEKLLNEVQTGDGKVDAGALTRLFDTFAKLERMARAKSLECDELNDVAPVNRMGRPRIRINWSTVEALCAVQATEEEIALAVGVSVDTMERATKSEHGKTFAEYFKEKRKRGWLSLRRKQYQIAMSGDKTMLVWLGKQWLDQRDRPEGMQEDDPLQGILDQMRKEYEEHKSKEQQTFPPGDVSV
jgi:AraC-like DNA-binding protein